MAWKGQQLSDIKEYLAWKYYRAEKQKPKIQRVKEYLEVSLPGRKSGPVRWQLAEVFRDMEVELEKHAQEVPWRTE